MTAHLCIGCGKEYRLQIEPAYRAGEALCLPCARDFDDRLKGAEVEAIPGIAETAELAKHAGYVEPPVEDEVSLATNYVQCSTLDCDRQGEADWPDLPAGWTVEDADLFCDCCSPGRLAAGPNVTFRKKPPAEIAQEAYAALPDVKRRMTAREYMACRAMTVLILHSEPSSYPACAERAVMASNALAELLDW